MKSFLIKMLRKKFVFGISCYSGRNFFGRKTIYTQGGGLKSKSYVLDFKRIVNYKFFIISVEKELGRSGSVGLIVYENCIFSYILLPELYDNVLYFNNLFNGFVFKFCKNSSQFFYTIPTGFFVHHVELVPGLGAKLLRSAGTRGFVLSKDAKFVYLKLKSGWLYKISLFCVAVEGIVSNSNHHLISLQKAGKSRLLGFRPRVRGVAMNPCDHPHGGGEGKGSPPRVQVTPWGKSTKIATKNTLAFKLKKKLFKRFV